MRHTQRPPSQKAATIASQTHFCENCSAPSDTLAPSCSAEFGVPPSEPPV